MSMQERIDRAAERYAKQREFQWDETRVVRHEDGKFNLWHTDESNKEPEGPPKPSRSVTAITGGKGRFDACQTVDDMKALLGKDETIGIYSYNGNKQVEVRKKQQGAWGVRRVATAELVDEMPDYENSKTIQAAQAKQAQYDSE